jgi:EmrB/QacA subfamily drug resistance transporter
VTQTDGPPDADPRRWRALALCLVAGFMTLLDVSIVNVALPSIRTGLHAGDSATQWIVAGYSLAFGIVLVPAGRLGDAMSRRMMFAVGVFVFTAASGACGAATTPVLLSVARAVQGFGGGLITPQISGFIQTLFRGRERGRAFGMFGATVGISTAVGPLLGGLLLKAFGTGEGWRFVFYVNVPVGIVALLLVRRWLPARTERKSRESLDPMGVLLFAAAVLFVLLPLVRNEQQSLSHRPWWLLGVSAVLFTAFVGWERRWRGRGEATLVDLNLVKVRSYMLGLSLGSVYFAGFTSVFLILTLYLQAGLGYDPLAAGLTQMPFAIGSAIAAAIGGRLVHRYGRALVVAGLVMVIVGLLLVDILVPHISSQVGLKLAGPLFLAGFGGGFVITPNITITLSEVPLAYAGSGGGMLQTAQRVGSAIGVAIVLAEFFTRLRGSHGDFRDSLGASLHTTIAFVVLALILGIADLVTGRRAHAPASEESPVPA